MNAGWPGYVSIDRAIKVFCCWRLIYFRKLINPTINFNGDQWNYPAFWSGLCWLVCLIQQFSQLNLLKLLTSAIEINWMNWMRINQQPINQRQARITHSLVVFRFAFFLCRHQFNEPILNFILSINFWLISGNQSRNEFTDWIQIVH